MNIANAEAAAQAARLELIDCLTKSRDYWRRTARRLLLVVVVQSLCMMLPLLLRLCHHV